tara:strand:- start:2421 stop:3344 length:924 start_codon:yes stop_codon:yes gene_type:complete
MNIIYHILEKQRDKVKQDPDIKDKKGTQPDVYYKGLKKSTKDKRDAHFKKGAKMDDDNPAAYKPAPGDANAKTKPSKHTKKFDKMFGEENIEEGKLVANFREILDVMTNQIKKEVGKRYQKSEESGIKLMNDLGRIVNMKVTDKMQQKNKLFLKFGDNMEEGSTGLHFVEKADIKKKLKSIKGITKKELEVLSNMPQPTLMTIIQQLSTLVMSDQGEDTMPDLDESLWANIHNKRKRGEKMRKPGEKGAPKPGDFKRARGEDLDKDSDAGDYVDDFKKSDAPQFKNKSAKKIRQMAIAAYLDSKEKK